MSVPYYLLDDQFADDPSWDVLSDGSDALADKLQASFARLAARVSGLRRDGYCTERLALAACRGSRKVLDLLAKSVLETAPWLHRPGDECECLGDAWIDGYSFRIHNFLKRNPSRREYERNRAQKADLRDARLKKLVYDRDGGSCRYCRSGPLSPKAGRSKDRRKVLSHDHVDPDQPAGTDGANLVIACGRCNDDKGHRTPSEADMPLLPAPTPAQAAAWHARGLVLNDRTDHQPITDETATDQQTDADPNSDPITDPSADPNSDSDTTTMPAEHPESPEQHSDQPTPQPGKGSSWVGAGKPVPGPDSHPPDTPRSPAHPDIYHRRSRAPAQPTRHDQPPTSPPAEGQDP